MKRQGNFGLGRQSIRGIRPRTAERFLSLRALVPGCGQRVSFYHSVQTLCLGIREYIISEKKISIKDKYYSNEFLVFYLTISSFGIVQYLSILM